MIINITGSPPVAALLRNSSQGDKQKHFPDFIEQVSNEISDIPDSDKASNINDINNPVYTISQYNKPFEPINNSDVSQLNIRNDHKFEEAGSSENKQFTRGTVAYAATSDKIKTPETGNSDKRVNSEQNTSEIPAEKPKDQKRNNHLANISTQESAPKFIIGHKAQKSSPESINNTIQDFKSSALTKSLTTENVKSVQIEKPGKENLLDAKLIQEEFKSLNNELMNSVNQKVSKKINQFNLIEKSIVEPDNMSAPDKQVKSHDQNEQPIRDGRPEDRTENSSGHQDANKDGSKGKENKAEFFQGTASFANVTKAFQKGSSAGLTTPLPAHKVEISQFTQRTMQIVKSIPGSGTTSAKLILSPPALGSLHIDISLKADYVRMSIKAENPDTLKMIENQIGALRDKLAENGLKTEKIELAYRNENQEKQLDAGQEKQRRNEEDKKLRRDFLRSFSGNLFQGDEGDSQLTYIPESGSYLSQRNLTGV